MKKLVKGAKPQILEERAAEWTAELVAVLARGEKPTEAMKGRYRHAQIKSAIIRETDRKCAYCESRVTHIAHGDIEHIVPKSKVPARAYDWDNLTLACDKCNENKGDHYSDDPVESQRNLVDPYRDDPPQHFLFLREVVVPRPDSMRALETEERIKLGRADLLERRRERMDFLDGLVLAWANASLEHKELLLRRFYDKHLKDSDEYIATCRAYIAHLQDKGILPR